MKTNYFLTPIPLKLLLSLLNELCVFTNHSFLIDMPTYYNGLHKGVIQQFMADCHPYYLPSKKSYTTNELTYKRFLTVVRHVCKIHNILYTSQLQYCHSLYQVVYYIHIPNNFDPFSVIPATDTTTTLSESASATPPPL